MKNCKLRPNPRKFSTLFLFLFFFSPLVYWTKSSQILLSCQPMSWFIEPPLLFMRWICKASFTYSAVLFSLDHHRLPMHTWLDLLGADGDRERTAWRKKESERGFANPSHEEKRRLDEPRQWLATKQSLARLSSPAGRRRTGTGTASKNLRGFFFCQYIFYKDGQIANRS